MNSLVKHSMQNTYDMAKFCKQVDVNKLVSEAQYTLGILEKLTDHKSDKQFLPYLLILAYLAAKARSDSETGKKHITRVWQIIDTSLSSESDKQEKMDYVCTALLIETNMQEVIDSKQSSLKRADEMIDFLQPQIPENIALSFQEKKIHTFYILKSTFTAYLGEHSKSIQIFETKIRPIYEKIKKDSGPNSEDKMVFILHAFKVLVSMSYLHMVEEAK